MQSKQDKPAYAMSKRRKNGIAALLLLLFAALVWLDYSPRTNRRPDRYGEPTKQSDFEKYHSKSFDVVNVIDGDTLDIDAPDGADEKTRIRLLGIDAPEAGYGNNIQMYFGPESTEFAGQLARGKTVTVFLDEVSDTRGKYGRLLAYVRLPDGRFLNEVLLEEGYAYADLRFRHSLYNSYKQKQSTARSLEKGLWKQASREKLPEWLQKREPALLLTD